MMVKHKSKSPDTTATDGKHITSAKEFREHVRRVSDLVIGHKQHGGIGAEKLAGQVDRTLNRLHDQDKTLGEEERAARSNKHLTDTLLAISSFVLILGGVSDYCMYMQSQEQIRIDQEMAIVNKIHTSQNRKYQAVGESVTRGLPTNRAVAEININKIEGNSYMPENGHIYEFKNSWSGQFNIDLGIVTKNGKENVERTHVLWLQDVFGSYKGKADIRSEVYHGTVRLVREDLNRSGEIIADSIFPWLSGNVAKEEAKPVDVLRGIKGRGKVGDDSIINGNETYLYRREIDASTKSVHIALDIRTAVKGPHEVDISFGYAPIEKGGRVNWKKETKFDNVTYHVKGTVVSAKMDFSSVNEAGLTISGYCNGMYAYIQKLSGGRLGLYEEKNGKLEALPISGFTDYQTAEYTYNVKSVVIHKGVVRISTVKGNKEK